MDRPADSTYLLWVPTAARQRGSGTEYILQTQSIGISLRWLPSLGRALRFVHSDVAGADDEGCASRDSERERYPTPSSG